VDDGLPPVPSGTVARTNPEVVRDKLKDYVLPLNTNWEYERRANWHARV
jgi:hypothetical protein